MGTNVCHVGKHQSDTAKAGSLGRTCNKQDISLRNQTSCQPLRGASLGVAIEGPLKFSVRDFVVFITYSVCEDPTVLFAGLGVLVVAVVIMIQRKPSQTGPLADLVFVAGSQRALWLERCSPTSRQWLSLLLWLRVPTRRIRTRSQCPSR